METCWEVAIKCCPASRAVQGIIHARKRTNPTVGQHIAAAGACLVCNHALVALAQERHQLAHLQAWKGKGIQGSRIRRIASVNRLQHARYTLHQAAQVHASLDVHTGCVLLSTKPKLLSTKPKVHCPPSLTVSLYSRLAARRAFSFSASMARRTCRTHRQAGGRQADGAWHMHVGMLACRKQGGPLGMPCRSSRQATHCSAPHSAADRAHS